MKKKDLLVLAGGAVLIVGAIVAIYFMFFQPKAKVTTTNNVVSKQTAITGVINDDTLNKINGLKNYVSTNLDNIGRTDPFGPLK